MPSRKTNGLAPACWQHSPSLSGVKLAQLGENTRGLYMPAGFTQATSPPHYTKPNLLEITKRFFFFFFLISATRLLSFRLGG